MGKMFDMYNAVKESVCRNTEVNEADMLSSNREECVDARSILVDVLIRKGVTEKEVSSLTGLTRQCVNKLKNGFSHRLRKWSVSTNLQSIDNELATGRLE